MATKNTTGTNGAEAAALPTADTKRLLATINDMDAISQEGFSHIEALARVALMALQTPDGHRFTEMIAKTLETISTIAQTSMDMVNSEAEEVGCNWIDADGRKRAAAYRDAHGHDLQSAKSNDSPVR